MKIQDRIIISVMGVIAVAAVAACSSGPSAKEAYEVFSMAMNKIFDEGKWTAKDHSMKDGVLSVNGVTVKLPFTPPNIPGVTETAPAPTELPLEIAVIEIKNILDKASMEKILAAADWRNQKETKLADSLTFKGVGVRGVIFGVGTTDMSAEELALGSIVLGAAGDDAPAGKIGFLKALRLGSLSYKNFISKSVIEMPDVPKAESEAVIGSVVMEAVAFGGQPLEGLEAIDPSGFFAVMSSMSAQSAVMKDFVLTTSDSKVKVLATIAGIDERDIKGPGFVGSLVMDDMKVDITGLEKDLPFVMTLNKMTANGLDIGPYAKKFIPLLTVSIQNPEAAEEALLSSYNLADLFVSPVSLDDLSLSGFELKLGELFGVKMAEAKMDGPYKAGEIPVNPKSSISGLEIILPQSDPGKIDGFMEMYEFARYFGMSRFEINIAGEGSYDAASGVWQSRLTNMSVKDLFDLSSKFELGGLTPERVEKLKSAPMNSASMFMIMMAPEPMLGDLAFNNLNIKLADKGLVNRTFKYAAAMEAANPDVDAAAVEALRQRALVMVDLAVILNGGRYLENPAELGKSLSTFLKEPGTLEINLAPDPPFSYKVITALGGDQNKLLNSLNISITANGVAAPALKFAIPTASYSNSYDDWNDENLDEEKENIE